MSEQASIKRLLGHVGIFTFSNILNAAVPFLLLPFLTRYLNPAQFGMVSLFQVFLNLLIPLVGLNMDSAVSRFYFDREQFDFKKFFATAIWLSVIGLALVLGLTGVFYTGINAWLFEGNGPGFLWLFAAAVATFFTQVFQMQSVLWQVQSKSVVYGLARIGKTLLEFALAIALVVWVSATWESRMVSVILSSLVSGLLVLTLLFRNGYLQWTFHKDMARKALVYGVPLIPHILSGVIISFSDRIFISRMIGIEATGLYAVGYQVGMVLSLIQSSFNQAWVPWLFAQLKDGVYSQKRRIVRFTYLYFLVMILCVLLLLPVLPFVFDWFIGKSFQQAQPFVFWIALGFAFNGMYKMVVNYLFYTGKTYVISLVTLGIAGLNLVLNYFLIKENGAIGSAQATAISFLVEFLIVWMVSHRFYPMPWFKEEKV